MNQSKNTLTISIVAAIVVGYLVNSVLPLIGDFSLRVINTTTGLSGIGVFIYVWYLNMEYEKAGKEGMLRMLKVHVLTVVFGVIFFGLSFLLTNWVCGSFGWTGLSKVLAWFAVFLLMVFVMVAFILSRVKKDNKKDSE